MMEDAQNNSHGEIVSFWRRIIRWLKVLGLLVPAIFLIFGALFITGRLLMSRQIASTTYEAVEVPVFQMHGALDHSQDIDSARALSWRLSGTHFVAIEGSDHHIRIDAPDGWIEEFTVFVETLGP